MATPTRSRQLEKYYYQAKIVVVGDMYVGKSASVHRLCTGKFYGNYMVTVGDLFNGVSFRFFVFVFVLPHALHTSPTAWCGLS